MEFRDWLIAVKIMGLLWWQNFSSSAYSSRLPDHHNSIDISAPHGHRNCWSWSSKQEF